MVSITLERLWMVSDRIVDFRFFVKFHRSGPEKFSVFELLRSMLVVNQKRLLSAKLIWTSSRWLLPNPAKIDLDFIYYDGQVLIQPRLEGLWTLVSDRIVDF